MRLRLKFETGRLAACAISGLLLASGGVRAQSTDGYHAIQVFPVVVDSTSFTQSFHFRALEFGTDTIEPIFYPAGQGQAAPVSCPSFQLPWRGENFASLRAICPGLGPGSQYGMLVLKQTDEEIRKLEIRPFSAYSRVSNPAGAGFSVEAFPAHTFTAAFSMVTGLRRKAATPSSPSFQTNCFIGLLPEVNGSASEPSQLQFGLVDSQAQAVGDDLQLELHPGQIVRYLDIFSAAGAPATDFDNVTLYLRNGPGVDNSERERPGIVAFCTVQDNTSFGADFRIAKQEYGIENGLISGIAAQDDHVDRETFALADMPASGGAAGRGYAIEAGAHEQNSHVMYFRHPDWVACELTHPTRGGRIEPDYGLEMRLVALDAAGPVVLAGGHGATGWSRVYLGDKREHGGQNTRYLLQVEDSEQAGPIGLLGYGLHCQSGSGHTPGDVISFRRPANEF